MFLNVLERPRLRLLRRIAAAGAGLLVMGSTSSSFGLELASKDIKPNSKIDNEFVYDAMGCPGKNISPELHWKDVPKGTKSFAVTVYDPKAPTGSGWWHWIVFDLPATTTSLPKGWQPSNKSKGTVIINDYGSASYGGPCPPPGKPHPYIFTVYALKTGKLDVPPGATNAVARFVIDSQTIKKASFTAHYGR